MIFTESLLADLFTLSILLTTTIFLYFKWSYQYWKNRHLNFLPPTIPYGNMKSTTSNIHPGVRFLNFYREIRSKNWKHAGLFTFNQPIYMPVDPEYIKLVMTKDFQHFLDRGTYYNERDDPLSAHLFAIGGSKWRHLRTKLTPTFTSGKMKMMFPILVNCLAPLHKSIEKTSQSGHPIDVKEVLASFTTDIIGSAAFGLDFQSFGEETSPFRVYGKRVFQQNDANSARKRRFLMAFPNLSRKLRMKSLPEDISEFFMGVVRDTVEHREKTQEQRKDFLQLLIDLKNSQSDSSLTLEEVAAQAFVFFIAGFETSSTTMTFALYELARNVEMQEKVREEVRKVLEKHGELSYEAVGEMKYLGQVVDETLRMYPPLSILVRKCVQDYRHPLEEGLVIERGTQVFIPIYGLHCDEEYFPEPEKFDPERFSEENKRKMNPYCYLPFGEGPRNCIGMRFGLMQTKVGLAALVDKFRFSVNEKTREPIEFDLKSVVFAVKGDLWLDAEKL